MLREPIAEQALEPRSYSDGQHSRLISHQRPGMLVRTINSGDYYADILTSPRNPEPYFIYVVQRQGSADVLAMGCCHSEKEAVASASDAVRLLRTKAATA